MKEIKYPTTTQHWICHNADGSVMSEGVTEPNQVTTTGQPELVGFDTEEQLVTYIAGMEVGMFPELPNVGEWVEARIYKYGTDKVKCITAHTRMHYAIEDQPALFLIIPTVVGYQVWKQPTVAHDAFQKGDRVHFPDADSPVYESKINANTWSPTAYPAGWLLIT
jgi:hypothetical protein